MRASTGMDPGGFDGRLQNFGFSEKEAAVYRSLLQFGEAKPSQIASAADVSTRYVYEVGERLASRGFVTVNDHVTPTVMRAVPPEEVIDGLSTELEDLEELLQREYEAPDREEMRVEVIKTTMTLRKRLRNHIDDATETIALCIPSVALTDVAAELREARDRGVFVQLLLGGESALPDVEGVADVVRTKPRCSLGVATFDDVCGIVMTSEMLERLNSGDRAILCDDARLGRLLYGGYMGSIWVLSEEAYVAEPAALPEIYRNIRPAVLAAACHNRDGMAVRACVEGVDRATGDTTEVSGPIAGLHQAFIAPERGLTPTAAAMVLETDEGDVHVGGHYHYENSIDPELIRLDVADD